MPAVREQGPEALAGVDAVAVQQQAGMGIGIAGSGKFELTDLPITYSSRRDAFPNRIRAAPWDIHLWSCFFYWIVPSQLHTDSH